jgi:hypothetical protein
MRRRVIRLEHGRVLADEERGLYHGAAQPAASEDREDLALAARVRNGPGQDSILPE